MMYSYMLTPASTCLLWCMTLSLVFSLFCEFYVLQSTIIHYMHLWHRLLCSVLFLCMPSCAWIMYVLCVYPACLHATCCMFILLTHSHLLWVTWSSSGLCLLRSLLHCHIWVSYSLRASMLICFMCFSMHPVCFQKLLIILCVLHVHPLVCMHKGYSGCLCVSICYHASYYLIH